MTPQLDGVYVPLAIVERKPSKPPSRDQPEEKEEEKLIPIAEERFFEDVLRQGKSDISQGRKIAIIGEPGAGKTTRLQKIADWILEQDLGLPIWIDLAELGEQDICQYLEKVWLSRCRGEVTRRDLEAQISRVWLLLDGVDEMTHTQGMQQLGKDLLRSWVQAARVVVTCRVNVWEADKNAFSGFDVFRNLEFNPEQVKDYICRWFAGMGDAATGESLEAELAESENSRLKELIQNPLRLWMLCLIWQTGGGLPETQAGLYAQFVDWVYRWKADEEILDQREAIDTALARLALAAMDEKEEVSRLRLRESWVLKVLGSRPMFEAVMKLGWLNRVERFPQAICVFYHATFQEYFAALAVEDWDDFLPRNHVNFPVPGKKYRIFEPQWKQVILLWIGRTNLENNKEKEKFIYKLIDFEYGCSYYEHDFYKFRAQFLAAWLIQDLENNDWKNYFINWLIKIGVGWWNSENNEWQYYLLELNSPIARQTLIQINTDFAREKLLEIIDRTDEDFILSQAVWCLGEMYPTSDRVINKLLSLICKSSKTATEYKVSGVHYQAIGSLSKIALKNQTAILFLKELIDSRIDLSTKITAIKTLAKISPDFVNEASEILLKILNDTSTDGLRCDLAIALGEISPIHQEFVVELLAQIPIKHESITQRKVEKYLASIQKKSVLTANSEFTVNQEYDIIQDLIKLVNDIVTDFNEKTRIIELLSPLLDSNKVDEEREIYKLLLNIITFSNSESLKYVIGYRLQETKKTQAQLLFIIEYLSKYLTLDYNMVHYQLLWHCAQNLPYPDFYRAWHGLTET
ncbi:MULTISPECIES: NACHT domain-containing protein [unclassified Microcoleus]|uniref:NACHT domain-containing protein n=1 Tax=unclassified Microcoleus TaxID=2642155 RepID=UPI002FD62820